MPKVPTMITTAELHRLFVRAEPLWLIYVPDIPGVATSHIPGSLATGDEDLLAALAAETPMVLYGDNRHSKGARTIAARLASQRRDARWYVGGLEAWIAARYPVERA